ncbi:MAG: hypothetical protein ACRELB_18905, partial [Polyangiaceae bacterium]
ALSGVLPRVLFRTPSQEDAERAASVLSLAGVVALAVDVATVTPAARMVRVHRFVLEDKALRADARGPVLPYEDIAAIARVASDTAVHRTTRERDVEPVGGRGGVGWGRGRAEVTEVDVTRTEHAVEQMLVLFVRDGGVPWVVTASEARYLGLGALLRPTQLENLLVLATLLRERAPGAAYDERFVSQPLVRTAEVRVRDHDGAVLGRGDAGIDVRLHLLGHVLVQGGGRGPYR